MTGHIRISVGRNDPCPCGSDRKAKHCLPSSPGKVHPDAVATHPPSPRTNHAHPDCYASALFDCCAEISLEHFGTRSLQNQLHPEGMARASGFDSRDPNRTRALPVDVLRAANVLCRRHNSALSPLDRVGLRLGSALQRLVLRPPDSTRAVERVHLMVNGHDVERWMLKQLLGHAKSGTAGYDNRKIAPGQVLVGTEILAVLMGDVVFARPHGLYVRANRQPNQGEWRIAKSDGGSRVLLDLEDGQATGIEVRVASFDLVLWIDPRRRPLRVDIGPGVYRPRLILDRRRSENEGVELSWMNDVGSEIVEIMNANVHDATHANSFVPSTRWRHPTPGEWPPIFQPPN